MIIKRASPKKNYSKVDNTVYANPQLSLGAKAVYGYLCTLRTGANYSDKYICKVLNISTATLTRYKKELKDANLIALDQVSARLYVVYIGYSTFTAEDVKRHWEDVEDVNID